METINRGGRPRWQTHVDAVDKNGRGPRFAELDRLIAEEERYRPKGVADAFFEPDDDETPAEREESAPGLPECA